MWFVVAIIILEGGVAEGKQKIMNLVLDMLSF